jgi:hypothetical protein
MVSTTTHMGGSVRTVSHRYDRDGADVETTFPDGAKFWTARDGLGRMGGGYSGALGDTSVGMIGSTYDSASNLYYRVRRWGVSTYSEFDGLGRPSKIYEQFGDPAARFPGREGYRPFFCRCLSRSRTMLPSPSGSRPIRRATS